MPTKTPSTSADTTEKPHGSEIARDAARDDDKPKYGGEQWAVAAERGERRFGTARNDDADPSTMTKLAGNNDDDESPTAADPELQAAEQAGEIESGGQREGMSRGEKPRKPAFKTKHS